MSQPLASTEFHLLTQLRTTNGLRFKIDSSLQNQSKYFLNSFNSFTESKNSVRIPVNEKKILSAFIYFVSFRTFGCGSRVTLRYYFVLQVSFQYKLFHLSVLSECQLTYYLTLLSWLPRLVRLS